MTFSPSHPPRFALPVSAESGGELRVHSQACRRAMVGLSVLHPHSSDLPSSQEVSRASAAPASISS